MKERYHRTTRAKKKAEIKAALKSRVVRALLVAFLLVFGFALVMMSILPHEEIALFAIIYLLGLASANAVMNTYELAQKLRHYRYAKY